MEEIMNSFLEEKEIIDVRRSILIIDDEMINQELLGNILKDDYEILYASDGVEALESIKEHKDDIALIMLDLIMPRMGGVEFIGRIKEDSDLRQIPIIVLTSDKKSEVECLQLGALDFIPKPYPAPEVVKARVNKCIELSEDRSIIRSTERDSLTKLFNIEYFIRYVHLFDHHYQDTSMDALVVDVNRFHMINERYGKDFGDAVLRRVGERVKQQARKLGGVGCRQSSDTFLIYAPHKDNYEDVLERLSEGLAGDGEDAPDCKINLRVGVYYEVDKSIDVERRFDRAKMAADSVRGMYDTSIGEYDHELHEKLIFSERLLNDFRTSLAEKHFAVFLQPKFDVRPDKPVLTSAEALVRWNHPELGMISPGLFIPLLEENGLIPDLDYYVWKETASYIRACKDKFGFSVPVSVNVSRAHFIEKDLAEQILRMVDEAGCPHNLIEIELTESAFFDDKKAMIETIKKLKSYGFAVSMDDFGAGYSSLNSLKDMPLDVLKLDADFFRGEDAGERGQIVVSEAIRLGKSLNMRIVAEGVEDKEQVEFLASQGCDMIQGYYYAKPMPKDDYMSRMIKG